MITIAREVKKRGGRKKSEQDQLLQQAMDQRRKQIIAAEKFSKGNMPDLARLVESSTHDLVTSLVYLVFEMKGEVAAIKRKLDPSSSSVPGLGQGFDSQSYATLAENAAAALDDEDRKLRTKDRSARATTPLTSALNAAADNAGGVKFELGGAGLQPSLTAQLSDAEARLQELQEAAAKEATVVESIKSRTTSAAPTPRGTTQHAAASLPHLTGEVSPR